MIKMRAGLASLATGVLLALAPMAGCSKRQEALAGDNAGIAPAASSPAVEAPLPVPAKRQRTRPDSAPGGGAPLPPPIS